MAIYQKLQNYKFKGNSYPFHTNSAPKNNKGSNCLGRGKENENMHFGTGNKRCYSTFYSQKKPSKLFPIQYYC